MFNKQILNLIELYYFICNDFWHISNIPSNVKLHAKNQVDTINVKPVAAATKLEQPNDTIKKPKKTVLDAIVKKSAKDFEKTDLNKNNIEAIEFTSRKILGIYRASTDDTIDFMTRQVIAKGNCVVSFIYDAKNRRK